MTAEDLSTIRWGLLAWLGVLLGGVALAAAADSGNGRTGMPPAAQFRTGVETVELYVSVTDATGRPVTTLGRDDFQVLEDGQPQSVSVFAAGGVPLALGVAIDRSFSVAGALLAVMKTGAARLLASLQPDDRVLLLGIGSRVDVLAPLGTDRSAQLRALSAIDAFGSTSLHDAIVVAIDRIQDARGRRALVLLSDGVDRFSQRSATEVVAHAKDRDVLVFPVAIGGPASRLFLDVAAVSGGEAFGVRDPARLGETLQALAVGLRAQYLLGYAPGRAVSDVREWRSVRVVARRPGLTVRTRQGYWTQPLR